MKRQFTAKDIDQSCAIFMVTTPAAYGAEDFNAMDNRVYLLEALYNIDGRSNPTHPLHHTYTGLWNKYFKL
jgi:hypothetical protein